MKVIIGVQNNSASPLGEALCTRKFSTGINNHISSLIMRQYYV